MTVADNIFPQSGDEDFAENFATWLGRGNISDYVETGLSLTVDYGASPPQADISDGKAFLIVDEATISSNGETRLVLDYSVTVEAKTGVSLNGSEPNNLVYLNPNIGSNDSPTIEVETDSGNAGSTWLLIARVDTVANTVEQLNRNPDADFDNFSARNSLDIPTYSEFSEADESESSTIYIDGSGSPDAGIYVHDGSSFISSGVRELSKLLDVDGVEGIIADSSGNRPSAGTSGRLFIDESTEKIQLDTGSVWVDIGTNPDNIGAGDLGFDPATQNELDSHASDNNIHHSRPVAGNGLKDQSNNFNIEPSDFAGLFLNDDSDNLEVQIGTGLENDGSGQIQFDEAESYTFSSQQIINGILTMGADIDLSNNNLVEPNQIETSGSGSDVITVRDTSSASDILTLSEGGTVAVTSGDLTNGGTTTIFDQSASHVPLSALENDSVTIGAGDGLKNGGSVQLGSTTTIDIEPADFAGDGLVDDGSDNLALESNSITVNTNDGLKSGGSVSLGGSVTIDIKPADFAGKFLSDDGTDDLQVNTGTGLEGDGADNLRVDEDYSFAFSSTIDFTAGLDTQANITDGTQVIWDATAGEIPDSALGAIGNSTLANDSITVNANDGLRTGGTASLGGSIGLDIDPQDFAGTFLSEDASNNLQVNTGTGVEGDGADNLRVDEDYDFTFTSAIDFSAGLDTQGDISDGTQTIWDASVGEIPDSALGSIDNTTLTNSSVTLTAGDGLKSGGSVSLGGSVTLNIEPNDFAGSGLVDDGTDNLALSEDSVTVTAGTDLVGGGSVSLGGSVTIDHEDTSTQSNVSAGAGAAITDVSLDGNGHVTSLSTTGFDSRYVTESGDTMGGDLTAPSFTLTDSDGDTAQWSVSEDSTSGNFTVSDGTSTRVDIDTSGNIRAEGELTEGAAL